MCHVTCRGSCRCAVNLRHDGTCRTASLAKASYLDVHIEGEVCFVLTPPVFEHQPPCDCEFFAFECLVTGITVHIPLHKVHGHVGSPITVFEQNIHGPLFLVNDRDLTEEAT